MTMYGLPDITGTNSDYLQVNVPFYVYQTGIQIPFENSPIFSSSLVITLTDGSGTTLVKGTDWVVNTNDIDQGAMGRAYLMNPSFSGQLVKSITISSTVAVGKRIAMNYQEFYLTTPGRTQDNGTPLELSPSLINYLMTTVAVLKQQVAGVVSPVVSNLTVPSLLPLDINSEFSGNVVTAEPVTINTIAGATVIQLANGAFFADSLVLTYNGTTLSASTDYLPYGLSPLTQQSTNKSGIYHYILINNTNINGSVAVTYHALGGQPQLADIKDIYNQMVAIKTFLNSGDFVTPDGIGLTPAFAAFNARLNIVEEEMRALATGAPTYGDSTAGNVTIRPITSVDANFHWWTIATLYQVAGSTTIFTADRFKFRAYLPTAQVSLTATVDVNLSATRNKVSVTTESLVFNNLYDLFTDIDTSAAVYPMVRVAWNQSGSSYSGAVIQLGIPLTNLSDTMTIEDLSTTQSCWLLDTAGAATSSSAATPSTYSDTGFTLPDGVSTWTNGGSVSYSQTSVPTFSNGYLIYAGSNVTLANINTTAATSGLFNSVLPYYFPVNNVRQIVVTLLSANNNTVYDVVIPVNSITSGIAMGTTMFTASTGEVVQIKAILSTVSGSPASISLTIPDTSVSVWTNTGTNYTDVIRYIRAKV